MERPTARQSAWQWQERIGIRDRKTLDGDQSLFFNRLMDLGDPLEDYDAVNKKYVDDVFGDGEIIVVIGSVDDIADLDLDPGSIAGSDADAVMAVHLAMYDHTLIGSGVDLTEHLAAYDHTNIHPSNIIDGDTVDVSGRDTGDVLTWNGAMWVPAPVVLADGSVALTADWDAGSHGIKAQTFESDQVTGTAPFVVASTTKVTNLNADKLDGLDDTAFLKHSLATAANDFLVASGAGVYVKKTLAETQAILGCRLTGWIDAPALTFSAADAPVYTVTCNGDYTLIIPVGARIALTHSGATKYFIVVKTSYSSPNTTFTLYGGTDYTLAAGAITNPYYSIAKAPVGFPLDPTKWTVTFTDSTKREQATPTAGTWYNLGSLSVAVPIGAWRVRSKILAQVNRSGGVWVDLFVTISTGNNNESTPELTDKVFVKQNDSFAFAAKAQGLIVLASKTTHYFNAKTVAVASSIEFSNDQTAMVVKFECAYL